MDYAFAKEITDKEIKQFRKTNHLTQRELANLLNISIKTVENWEKENNKISGASAILFNILIQNPELIEHYKIDSHQCNYRLYYMSDNLISTIIDIDFPGQKVYFKNYTKDIHKKAFGNKQTVSLEDLDAFLESRCFPKERDHMKLILNELNIPFYDPLLIIEKTQGRMAEDNYWIKVEKTKYDRDK